MPLDKRKVSLQFPTLKDLLDFTITINLVKCEINRRAFILVAELPEADIELAKRGFGSEVERVWEKSFRQPVLV